MDVFTVLADPTRRRVVELLGHGPHRAGDLSRSLGVSAPALSRHLRVLLEAGVVADQRVDDDARVRMFHLRPESLEGLQAWIDQIQAHWNVQLGAFKRHVETRRPAG